MTPEEKASLLFKIESALVVLNNIKHRVDLLTSTIYEAQAAIEAEYPVELPVKGSLEYNDRT